MDPGGGRLEAQRLLEIAEKLLDAQDLVGSKRFAERALESDPLLEGVDQILAVVDVLLASQRRINNQHDWYSILQLPHPSSSPAGHADDSLAIKRSYRRFALLLSPERNLFPGADSALRFVGDAFLVLSDPAKKSMFDSQVQFSNSHLRSKTPTGAASLRLDPTFWTSCRGCCHVFEYDRAYLNLTLRCKTCMLPFQACEMVAPPPIVPGSDMYYCSWGFFPLGFPGGPSFSGIFQNPGAAAVPELGSGWKAFNPTSSWWGNQPMGQPVKPLNAVPVNVAVANPNAVAASKIRGRKGIMMEPNERNSKMQRKAVVKKSVGNYARKSALFGETDSENDELEEQGEGGSLGDAAQGPGIANLDIDLDATEDVLGNLHNLPFLREEEIQIQVL
ncbi:hypothetical protein AXF42_Ash010804 [Apostasia shenzhenica]|uniref:J domain-containing protein n=1 Tax=Apostasia shenzhenica TaxID=1088818 RepID=A0A2I0A0P5_9ASPA|nr:hypothetical protein AXF42_Ash010804 [Apostasia shenzhenica]